MLNSDYSSSGPAKRPRVERWSGNSIRVRSLLDEDTPEVFGELGSGDGGLVRYNGGGGRYGGEVLVGSEVGGYDRNGEELVLGSSSNAVGGGNNASTRNANPPNVSMNSLVPNLPAYNTMEMGRSATGSGTIASSAEGLQRSTVEILGMVPPAAPSAPVVATTPSAASVPPPASAPSQGTQHKSPPSLGELGYSREDLSRLEPRALLLLAKLADTYQHLSANALSSQTEQMGKVLNFKGFNYLRNRGKDIESRRIYLNRLNILTKVDLTAICGLFGLNHNGTKIQLSDRILGFMEEPRKKVGTESRSYGTTGKRLSAVARLKISGCKALVPGKPVSTRSMPGFRTGPTLQHASSRKRPNAEDDADINGRMKISTGLGHELDLKIASFDSSIPESPFIVNHSGPLGTKKYLAFMSSQLDNSEADQVLYFQSPPPVSVVGHDTQVHLRCVSVDVNTLPSEWKQQWPCPAYAKVNGSIVTLDQARRYTNGKLAGVDRATNVQPYLKKRKHTDSLNHVAIKRAGKEQVTPSQGIFMLFAQQVLVKTTDQVIKEVRRHTEEHMREKRIWLSKEDKELSDLELEEKFVRNSMNDEGVITESVKISLRCPLAFTRIDIPVKSTSCEHIQCFDLRNYLEYSRKSLKFECPVCNQKNSQPSSLIISCYFQDVLDQFQNVTEVEVTSDAKARLLSEAKPNGRTPEKQQGRGRTSDGMEAPSGLVSNPETKQEPVHALSSSEVIDLTLDDEDEGETNAPILEDAFTTGFDAIESAMQSHNDGYNFEDESLRDMTTTRDQPQVARSLPSFRFAEDETIVLSD